MNPVHVIGIGQGPNDLTGLHLERIYNSDLLVGGQRQLDLFPDFNGDTLMISGGLDPIINRIVCEMKTRRVVVLASGDPLFHGIGATLSRHIPFESLVVHPNITSVGAAFAAICQPWHDAKIVSLHSRTDPDFSFASLSQNGKVAFLTSPNRDPGFIARQLISHNLDGFKICVLENLGDPHRERIQWFTDYQQVNGLTFRHPNLVILLKSQAATPFVSHETFVGMPDNYFRHSKGLITKSEVRAITISRLKLTQKDHVLWDIGSGSGSVAIEASLHLPWGSVYAVEKNTGRIPTIIHNIKNFNRLNIKVTHLNFPEGHEQLESPDRIFIGGGGKGLDNILTCCCQRLKPGGVLVVNTVILESMETARSILADQGYSPDMVQVQISRATPMPYGNRMNALNPVWIITGSKPNHLGGTEE